MQVDKTTINDLSIFNADETLSVVHKLDFTTTVGGKDWLRALLAKPLDNLKQIREVQQLLQNLIPLLDHYPTIIIQWYHHGNRAVLRNATGRNACPCKHRK